MELGKSVAELNLGERASFTKTISEADVYLFAGITGDFNPMHVNEDYARQTKFGGRIAHGPLTASLIAPVLGMFLPGLGTILLELNTKYLAPVRIGDTVTATAEVVSKDEAKNVAVLKCRWVNQAGTVVVEGEAKVKPPVKRSR